MIFVGYQDYLEYLKQKNREKKERRQMRNNGIELSNHSNVTKIIVVYDCLSWDLVIPSLSLRF